MGRYMENESLDVAISAIVDKELEKYRHNLLEAIEKHFDNPYCATTDIDRVMYKKEIVELINRIDI